MKAHHSSLLGFSLPHTPSGISALVDAPDWYFGGDLMEVLYSTDPEIFESLLPYPFRAVPNKPIVSIAMVDMVSVASEDQAYNHPEKTNYRECIIKMYCTIDNQEVWYAPAAWVTKDFSLMRGFLMGFGKKIGSIELTNPHPLNPILHGMQRGSRLKGICEAFNNVHFEIGLTLVRKAERTEKIPFSGMPLCVTRHVPDTAKASVAIHHDVSRLKASNYRRENVWRCEGKVSITPNSDEPTSLLQPKKVLEARTFSEGFVLHGTETIYAYGSMHE